MMRCKVMTKPFRLGREYPEAEQQFVDIVIITHCAGLLASEFPRLAAAAAAVLAHFFGPEGVDGQAHFVVLQVRLCPIPAGSSTTPRAAFECE